MLKTRVLAGVIAVLCIGLAVTSVGWFRSQRADGQPRRFDSCRIEGGVAVLSYTYGVNEKVTLSTDSRGDDGIVVSFSERQGGGATPAVGLLGQFQVVVGQDGAAAAQLAYPDGKKLNCKPS